MVADVDEHDIALRNETYRLFVEMGRAPSAGDVASATDMSLAGVRAGWERLHRAHALVLESYTREIRMANTFSAVRTPFHVEAGGRSWYANCAWDAFGI